MPPGYIQEIFSSFQGEGASIEGSCYGLRQIFVRFSGCPLALGVHGTKGCIWCDSPKAKTTKQKTCYIEKNAGNQKFREEKNPISPENIIKIIQKLTTRDLHSISLTGGEPLYQPEFLEEILNQLKTENYKIFLETAFTDDFKFLEKIAGKIDYASVDLKDRTAGASTNWEQLIEEESKMMKILKNAGTKVFAKTVITKSSKKEDFEEIIRKCSENDVPIAIQIVTPIKGTKILQPTWDQIKEFSELAGKYLLPEKIGISVQMHKSINIL
ncbi:MAG: 7-carboxy-7-deazaguanine synthase QueE [Candidatus Heimdallarchaeota archaeon]|nr:7-carboxy-7-deazaguanine synthase QueE [Candidatus Heimdallarchaeota archaeon]